MNKIIFIIIMALIFLALNFSLQENKIYDLIGSLFICILLLSLIIVDVYKYYKNNKQISGPYFGLQRDGLVFQILLCALFIHNTFIHIENGRYIIIRNIEIVPDIFLLMAFAIQLIITMLHVPKLSINGFLCSDGKFIPFSSINSIGCETLVFNNKKLIVKYEEKCGEFFKVSKFEYEKVKEHLVKYGSISINEIS